MPIAGLRALQGALRSSTLARSGQLADARVAADDCRVAIWYVVGFGLTALILAFLFWFFGSNDGRVRAVLFDWHFPLGHMRRHAGRASGSTSRSSPSPR